MSKKDKGGKSLRNIRTIQSAMIAGYALIVIIAITVVTQFAVRKTDEVLKNKVISLTSSLGVQMKLNMQSYLSRMETIATLAFGEEEAYTYDAADENNDEYEAINKEKVITDKLFSLCIMENFVDYGIVYSNNRTVGKISNATLTHFGDRIFDDLSSMISSPRRNDGWATGYDGDFKRVYYVKRVHERAVLVISFYAHELDSVFDNPEALSDMDISLVNQDYNILYSKNGGEVGAPLSQDIRSRIEGQSSAAVMDNDYLVSVNSCGDWYVVCSIPTKIILEEKNDMKRYIYMTGILAAVAAAFVGLYLSIILTKPVKKLVASLDDKARLDMLTGMLNKLTFEEYAKNSFECSVDNEYRALVILDIDDFKSINDTLGHAVGDKVLKNVGSILKNIFSEDDYLGRIGGDEFCIQVNTRADTLPEFMEHLENKCRELCTSFHKIYADDACSMKVSVSVGAAVYPEHGRDFAALYNACDKALYISKKAGKDTYNFYNESMEGGEEQ